jgi:hypothetical protein
MDLECWDLGQRRRCYGFFFVFVFVFFCFWLCLCFDHEKKILISKCHVM